VVHVSVADSNFNLLNSNRSVVDYSLYSYRNDTYQSWNAPLLESVLVRGPAKKFSSFGGVLPSLVSHNATKQFVIFSLSSTIDGR
jgi:hypothetical protein